MRFLLYNIAYGTGGPRSYAHRALTLHKYLRAPWHHMQRVSEFIVDHRPDVLGVVEVDSGSFRAGGRNQVAELARDLSHNFTYSSKYRKGSVCRLLPILRHRVGSILLRLLALWLLVRPARGGRSRRPR